MKHLLNNLSTEERERILGQYSESLIVETKNFKKLINAKSGSIKPLLNEQVQYPIQKKVVTQTTTQSPDQVQQQRLQQQIKTAQDFIITNLKKGNTINLFDKPNDTKPIGGGGYEILGVPNELSYDEIDPTLILKTGKLTFTVKPFSNKSKVLTITFSCTNEHVLFVNHNTGISRVAMNIGDTFGGKQSKVYSKNLTNNLMTGYCQAKGKSVVPMTNI